MKLVTHAAVVALFTSLMTLVACSSSSSSSSSDNCDEASKIADSCSSSSDAGSVKITFDAAKCKGNDQGEKAAACIVSNKSKCDCIAKCALTGSCS